MSDEKKYPPIPKQPEPQLVTFHTGAPLPAIIPAMGIVIFVLLLLFAR